MTVFVETHLTELEKQIEEMSKLDERIHSQYCRGALDALRWIKNGGEPVWTEFVGKMYVTLNATGPDQHA